MPVLFIILVGVSVASFIGSSSFRVSRRLSIITPPSYCPSCHTRLRFFELIPVVSFVLLRGKCRYCHYRIPIRYFIVEIALPVLWVALYLHFGISLCLLLYAYLAAFLFYLSLIDIDTGSIAFYDIAAVWVGGILFVVFAVKEPFRQSAVLHIYGFMAVLILLLISIFIVWLIKKRIPLGAGDVFVIPGAALYFGVYEDIRILIFSSLIGIITGMILILSGKVHREFKFPMMPFFAAGVCIEILFF